MQVTAVLTRLVSDVRRLLPALLTLLALVLAALGQGRFEAGQLDMLGEGALLFVAAALCMVAARLVLRHPIPHDRPVASSHGTALHHAHTGSLSPKRWGMLLAGLFVAVVLLDRLARAGSQPFSPIYLWMWLLASALVTGASLPAPTKAWRPSAAAWLRAHRLEVLALSLVTLLSLLLRTIDLASAPYTISGDEANLAFEVQRVASGDLQDPFTMIRGGHTSLVAFLLAVPFQIFGSSIAVLRGVSALWGTLAIPLLFVLARPITGRRIALVAALFLATFPLHIHYSRIAPHAIWEATFFSAVLATFWWGMRLESTALWPFGIAGLLTGLSQYAGSGSRLLPLLLLLLLAGAILFRPEHVRLKLLPLMIMLLTFAVVAGPIYLVAVQSPALFYDHAAGENILQNGWLRGEVEIRGEGALPILWDQFRRTLFGFAFFKDRVESWNPGTPLAPVLFSLGLFFGLVASSRSIDKWNNFLLHAWFWLVIILAGTLTLNPPSSHRLVVLAPVVCLFAALGWDTMARILARGWPVLQQPKAEIALLALLVFLTLFQGIRAHEQYLGTHRFGGAQALIATKVGRDLASRPPDTTLVLLGAPRMYSTISPLAWLAPNYHRIDLNDPLDGPPSDLPENRPLMFVVLPHRINEAGYILERYPEARREDVYAPGAGEFLYARFWVDG